ncbi:MAG TPA: SPOR domain-containing protein, partial [Allosphingosinicella sp.]|nr:SPOR domain-containing protein [Allosphingosinicella sp.]
MKKGRLGFAVLAAALLSGTGLASAAHAQYRPYREDPGTALTRHLRSLADQPRSLTALMGAGRAALDLGDPQAALTFYARAEEIAPRDGRVKAGMGSAFLQMEQPATAMRFFNEAASLGAPTVEFAKDRGLIYDLNGDPRRAQADYKLALARQDDAEVRRRLALSLAISGDKEAALRLADEQIRRNDRSGWRIRAFVLALTGDSAGAAHAARAVMPAQAASMQPFFESLPALTPAQRAMAVHYGHFPDGQAVQLAQAARAMQPLTSTEAGRPDASQKALGRSRSARASRRTARGRQAEAVALARSERTARSPAAERDAGAPRRLPGAKPTDVAALVQPEVRRRPPQPAAAVAPRPVQVARNEAPAPRV